MSKKKKSILSWGVTILAALCGVAAFFVVFAEAVKFDVLIFGTSFTGLQVGLGYSVNNFAVFEASAGIIFAYLLPLIGACLLVVGKGNMITPFLASAMMVAGGALALSTISLIVGPLAGTGTLGAGAIASGVLSLVGGVTACASAFVKG